MTTPSGKSLMNVRLGREPVWTYPEKIREVPSSWWDTIMDGTLWVVDVDSIPFKVRDYIAIQHATYRQAAKRGMKVSVRTGNLGRLLYIQGYPKEYNGYEVRAPLGSAMPAPQMPRLLRTPVEEMTQVKEPKFPHVQEQLMVEHAAGGWPHYPPAAMARNPFVGWVAVDCSCPTDSYRCHDETCTVTKQLPMLAAGIKLATSSGEVPEVWVQKQEAVYGTYFWRGVQPEADV